MTDTTSDGCSFTGDFTATLTQDGNDLSGTISVSNAVSPQFSQNSYCTLDDESFNFQGGTVSSSSFAFSTTELGGFQAKGYFTSDLIHGTFNECSDGSCATGTFTGMRTG